MAKKKRKKFNADELMAWNAAYENDMTKKDLYFKAAQPAFVFAFITTVTRYTWWLSIIMFIVGAIYGWRVYVPYIVRRNYESAAFSERNRFLNNATQLIINPNKTLYQALAETQERARGEFKEDLTRLMTVMMNGNDEDNMIVFRELARKYEHDIIFGLFVEQLETLSIEGKAGVAEAAEGKNNAESLKEIKTYHNDVKMKQMDYIIDKNNAKADMKLIVLVVIIMMFAMAFGFGFERFAMGFAWTWIGRTVGNFYIWLNINSYTKFIKYFYDDDVMEVTA